MPRDSHRSNPSIGPIPEPIDVPDTDPNPFDAVCQQTTAPRCYHCGSDLSRTYDHGFEAGISYAITQAQGLFETGTRGVRLSAEQAADLAAWLRRELGP